MKHAVAILLSILTLSFLDASSQESIEKLDLSAELVRPRNYIVTKTNEEINIDGLASELAWNMAAYSQNFIDIEGIKTPKFDTRLKMLWDENYLYVYAELLEPHIWGNLRQRDTVIFYNNDFEVFLDPSGLGKNYGEIEINALNTVWDLYLDKAYRVGGKANFHWNLNNLKSAVHIFGTLNNASDVDSMWTVEMAIPLPAMMELKGEQSKAPKEGEQWRINFSRVEWDYEIKNSVYDRKKIGGKYLPENNWVWSDQKVINMHEPEKWGFLQFTESKSAQEMKFIQDPDHDIKQVLFAAFRQTRFGKLKHLLKESSGYKKEFLFAYDKEKSAPSTFTKTQIGFEFSLLSPISNTTYIINEEGNLNLKP